MNFLHKMIRAAVMLCVALSAQQAVANDWNGGLGPKEYRDFMSKMKVGGDGPLDNQYWFAAGMLAGLQAAKEEYAKAGVKPLFCLPTELQPVDLRDLIFVELKDNEATWRGRPDARSEKIALHVVRWKFPC